MQSLMRLGMCAMASTACCAAVSVGDVAIQDLTLVTFAFMDIQIPYAPPPAVVVARKKTEPLGYALSPQVKSLEQNLCQDIVADPLGIGEKTAPNYLKIRYAPLPKELGGKHLVETFGQSKATSIIPQPVTMPVHGRVELVNFGHWVYYPNKGYEGKDQATFRVDTPNGSYRVVVNLWITDTYDEYAKTPSCARQFNIKNSALPPDDSANNLAAWQRSATLSVLITSAQQTLTAFTDHPATADELALMSRLVARLK